jgi:hypothetical protein
VHAYDVLDQCIGFPVGEPVVGGYGGSGQVREFGEYRGGIQAACCACLGDGDTAVAAEIQRVPLEDGRGTEIVRYDLFERVGFE